MYGCWLTKATSTVFKMMYFPGYLEKDFGLIPILHPERAITAKENFDKGQRKQYHGLFSQDTPGPSIFRCYGEIKT